MEVHGLQVLSYSLVTNYVHLVAMPNTVAITAVLENLEDTRPLQTMISNI